MRIRLEYTGLIFGIDEQGRVLLKDPAMEAQGDLF